MQLKKSVSDVELLSLPFKVPKPNEIKIAALQLPVMEGGKVHCLDVLYALTKRLLGEIEVNNSKLYWMVSNLVNSGVKRHAV